MKRLLVLTFLTFVAFSGCVEGPEESSPPSVEGVSNASSDVVEEEECAPETLCPLDACGSVEDGCGGTFECTEGCACEDTAVQIPSCGMCSLGVTRCDGEAPMGACEMPLRLTEAVGELQAADCEARIVYVDLLRASSGDGSLDAPAGDLQVAIDRAQAPSVIVVAGEPSIETEIRLRDGVSLLGGFTTQFERDETKRPALARGVIARDITSTTVVSRFNVRTPDETGDRENVAFFALNASGLVLEHMDVQSGQGGPGARGADGTSGKRGLDGEAGNPGRMFRLTGPNNDLENLPMGGGGDGGAEVVCADGATTEKGGNGGGGEGLLRETPQSSALQFPPPANGRSTSEAMRGLVEGPRDGESPMLSEPRGSDGQGAEAALISAEVVGSDWRVLSVGGEGDEGSAGVHGLGGAGGAGAKSPPIAPNRCGGAGGSGGGSGGCGGTQGVGGGAGWPSVAVFAVESTGLTFHDVTVQSGQGGQGGPGGLGGLGGSGGLGGEATLLCEDGSTTTTRPGAGGDGSAGQDGGHGGGGSGGASVGIVCVDSILEDPKGTLAIQKGQPGRGGTSSSSEGDVGLSLESHDCQIQ